MKLIQVTPMDKKRFARPQSSIGTGETTPTVASGSGGTAVAPLPLSDTEAAHQFFAEALGRLPGVLRVERWGEDEPNGPAYHVYLRPDDRATEYAIYEAKGQTYDRFPAAYLDVVVLEAIDERPPNVGPAA